MPHIHRPIFGNNSDAAESYIAIGKVVSHWGPIELALEGLLLFFRIRQGLNESKSFPTSFSTVTRQFLERVEKEAMYAELYPRISVAVVKAKELHSVRTVIAHGICQGTNLDGEIMFGKSHRREGFAYKEQKFSAQHLEALSDQMLALSGELDELHSYVQRTFLRRADGSLIYVKANDPGRNP